MSACNVILPLIQSTEVMVILSEYVAGRDNGPKSAAPKASAGFGCYTAFDKSTKLSTLPGYPILAKSTEETTNLNSFRKSEPRD